MMSRMRISRVLDAGDDEDQQRVGERQVREVDRVDQPGDQRVGGHEQAQRIGMIPEEEVPTGDSIRTRDR